MRSTKKRASDHSKNSAFECVTNLKNCATSKRRLQSIQTDTLRYSLILKPNEIRHLLKAVDEVAKDHYDKKTGLTTSPSDIKDKLKLALKKYDPRT